jgi:hypothetical protein
MADKSDKAAHLSVVRPKAAAAPRPPTGGALPSLLAAKAISGWAASREVLREPIPWRWGRLVADTHAVEISAPPGEGKTTLAALLAAALANPTGEPVALLGHDVKPIAPGRLVLVIGEENGRQSAVAQLDRAIQVLALPPEQTWERLVLLSRAGVRAHYLDDEDVLTLWRDVLVGAKAKLWGAVFLDTRAKILGGFGASKDEDGQADAAAMVTKLVELGSCPVVVLGHTRKGAEGADLEGMSGSAQRAAGVDVALLVSAKRSKGRVLSSTVTLAKSRDDDGSEWPEPMTFSLAKVDGAWTLTEGDVGDEGGKLPAHERVHAHLLAEARELTINQLREALAMSGKATWAALEVLRKEGRATSRETVVHGTKRHVFKARKEAFSFDMLGGGRKKRPRGGRDDE